MVKLNLFPTSYCKHMKAHLHFSDAILNYAAINSNNMFIMNDTANDPGLAGLFGTYPAAWLSIQGGIGDQVV